jgi:ABC-type Mn2+/Zn2+ transport system permease subunit
MLVAALIAVGSSVVGLYASYYANVASGAAIVLACTTCFAAAWAINAFRTRQARSAG